MTVVTIPPINTCLFAGVCSIFNVMPPFLLQRGGDDRWPLHLCLSLILVGALSEFQHVHALLPQLHSCWCNSAAVELQGPGIRSCCGELNWCRARVLCAVPLTVGAAASAPAEMGWAWGEQVPEGTL